MLWTVVVVVVDIQMPARARKDRGLNAHKLCYFLVSRGMEPDEESSVDWRNFFDSRLVILTPLCACSPRVTIAQEP